MRHNNNTYIYAIFFSSSIFYISSFLYIIVLLIVIVLVVRLAHYDGGGPLIIMQEVIDYCMFGAGTLALHSIYSCAMSVRERASKK
jgi:hypothetical protein